MLREAILCLTLCFLACLGAGAQDRSTPEATVRTFLAAFGSGDLKTAVACVKGAQPSPVLMAELAQQIKKEPVTFTLSNAKTVLNGATAAVTGQVTIKSGKADKPQTFSTNVKLALSDGKWQIVPDPETPQRNYQDMVNGLAYVLTDSKVFTQARETARAVSCLSNVKQICLGMIMFTQDSDEKFKLKPESYKKSIMPYIKNEAIFKCPSDSSGGVSYSFNSSLAGVSLAKLQYPADTVMIYEGKNGKLDFRHDGKAAVGFADGHAKLINAEGAKKLRWKP
jgi:prepilin-type processing-associated H-X9-DG protein